MDGKVVMGFVKQKCCLLLPVYGIFVLMHIAYTVANHATWVSTISSLKTTSTSSTKIDPLIRSDCQQAEKVDSINYHPFRNNAVDSIFILCTIISLVTR